MKFTVDGGLVLGIAFIAVMSGLFGAFAYHNSIEDECTNFGVSQTSEYKLTCEKIK